MRARARTRTHARGHTRSHFVPNLTLGAPIIGALRKHTAGFLDAHLMVSEPERWVDDFADAGADGYTFHIEATSACPPLHPIVVV